MVNKTDSVGRLFILVMVALVGCASATVASGEDVYLGGLPGSDRPIEVLMGFNLVNITDVGEKEETLDFDGAIYLEWQDPRLVYDPEEYGMSADWVPGDYSRTPARVYQGDYAVKELFEGWRPLLVIPNGVGDRSITNMAISIWPDGQVEYSETFYAKVETPMDLRRFPFDTQQLEIFFHPFLYQRDELVLVPDDRLARTWNQNLGVAVSLGVENNLAAVFQLGSRRCCCGFLRQIFQEPQQDCDQFITCIGVEEISSVG